MYQKLGRVLLPSVLPQILSSQSSSRSSQSSSSSLKFHQTPAVKMEYRGKSKFYVVSKGLRPGIYDSWEKCAPNIVDFNGCIYNLYWSRSEAEKAYNQYKVFENPTKTHEDFPSSSAVEAESISDAYQDQGGGSTGVPGLKCVCLVFLGGFLSGVVFMSVL